VTRLLAYRRMNMFRLLENARRFSLRENSARALASTGPIWWVQTFFFTEVNRDYNVEQIFITKQRINILIYFRWNCDFNGFNFKELCNLARDKCKTPGDDTQMSKHVGVYTVKPA